MVNKGNLTIERETPAGQSLGIVPAAQPAA
jgi:hypothetical protein